MIKITIPLLLIGLLLGLPAFADDALTTKTVRSFVDSIKELDQLSKKYEDDKSFIADEDRSMDQAIQMMQSPFSSAINDMKASKFYNEYLGVIKRHGFKTPEQWSQVGNRIYFAMAAVQMERETPGDIDQQMAQAQEQMKSSGMSAEQQKMMMDMMAASRQMIEQFKDVPQADKDAVKPYIEEFERLGEE